MLQVETEMFMSLEPKGLERRDENRFDENGSDCLNSMFDNTIFAVSDYTVHFLAAGSWRASG